LIKPEIRLSLCLSLNSIHEKADLVSFDGKQWISVEDFLIHRKMFSSSRTFIAPNGSKYKWKLKSKSNEFSLVEDGSKDVVAQSHRPKPGVISTEPRNKLNLDLTAQATSFIDLVVLTFIIMEEYERDRREKLQYTNYA